MGILATSLSVFVVMVFTLIAGGGSAAAFDYDQIDRAGRASGYLALCPKIGATMTMLETVAQFHRDGYLKPGDTKFELAQRATIDDGLRSYGEIVCDEAIRAFGPGGFEADGWLERRPLGLPFPVEKLIAMGNDEDPSDPVRDKVRVIAGVSLAMQQCLQIEATPVFVGFLGAAGIEIEDVTKGILAGPFFSETMNFLSWQSHDPKRRSDACKIALRNYGPGGRVVPGLIRQK